MTVPQIIMKMAKNGRRSRSKYWRPIASVVPLRLLLPAAFGPHTTVQSSLAVGSWHELPPVWLLQNDAAAPTPLIALALAPDMETLLATLYVGIIRPLRNSGRLLKVKAVS